MFFTELKFFIILIAALIIYYRLPRDKGWYVLLASSIAVVGMISVSYLVYALFFAIINYVAGLLITRDTKWKMLMYYSIVVLDVGLLVFFKYTNFLIESVLEFATFINVYDNKIPYFEILAPIGISFYTFQGIGYQIDLKRGHVQPERNIFKYLLFIVYFPKFVSGPVERSKTLLPQINKAPQLVPNNIIEGAKLFAWGLFKKLVIADHLYLYIKSSYEHTADYSALALFIILILQPLQIYADFSGYTDIARGISRMFGVELLPNFKNPFMATNVTNFWKRWHMSLTRWCGDYIYNQIILKRRKWKKWGAVYAVFVTFFIIGIWHGARWTYIVLGLLQGLVMSYEFFFKKWRMQNGAKIPKPLNNILSRVLTYLFFGFSLIFFNAPDIQSAGLFVHNLFFNFSGSAIEFVSEFRIEFYVRMLIVFIILWFDYMNEQNKDAYGVLKTKPSYVRWAFYMLLMVVLFSYGNMGGTEFVYAGF